MTEINTCVLSVHYLISFPSFGVSAVPVVILIFTDMFQKIKKKSKLISCGNF